MRKTLFGFMVVLMLTPFLACAMPLCPMMSSAQAATAPDKSMLSNMSGMSDDSPCHQDDKQSQKQGPMWALDCMGVDMTSQTASVDLKSPAQSTNVIHFAWADVTVNNYHFQPANLHSIRGPPDWGEDLPNLPSTFHITQRLRL